MTNAWMTNRRPLVIGGVVLAVVLVTILIVVAVLNSRADAPTGPAPIAQTDPPVVSPTPSQTPTQTPSPDDDDDEFDEDFGDTVVDVGDDGEAEFDSGLEVKLVTVKRTEVTGTGIGAANGPAYDIVIELDNDSDKKVDLSAVVVNVYTGKERTPATPADAKGAAPLSGSLAAGATVRGRYFFGVTAYGDVVRVTLSTSADSGLVVLEHR